MIEVMIIEDDPMVREINGKFLKKINGFNLVKGVSNLEEAREFICKNNVDLILLDVFLPKENGIDFLKWLRKQEIYIDVILITADKSIERVQEAFLYGAVDYLIKPFSFERFKEALNLFKERYHGFKSCETIEQDELDKLILNNKNISGVENNDEYLLEKGFNKYTYKSILNVIEKNEEDYFTAEEISEIVGIARVTVKKYLEYMDKEGTLDKLIEYGKVGRPQHKYKLKVNIRKFL